MAVYTLFGQPASPASLTSDTASYTMGMQFSLSQSATLTGIWFYSASGAVSLPLSIGIYQITGTGTGSQVSGSVVSSPAWSGAAGSGWVKAAYASGPVLSSGTNYRVCVCQGGTGNFWYSGTTNYWTTGGPGAAGQTSGIISAPGSASADSANQDAFTTSTSLTYPVSSFNSTNYWIDVEVTTAGGPVISSIPLLLPPGLASPAAWTTLPAPAPATGLTDPGWNGPPAVYSSGAEQVPAAAPPFAPPFTTPSSWSQPWIPRTDPGYPPPPVPGLTASSDAVPGGAQPGWTTPANPDITLLAPPVISSGAEQVPAAAPPFAPPFTTPSSWSQPWIPRTDPSWAGPRIQGTASRGRAICGAPVPKPGRAHGSPGTLAAAITAPAGLLTLTAPPGTVQAVTGTAGRVIRRAPAVIARGHGTGSHGTLGAVVTGSAAVTSVSGPAGTVQAVTGYPGRQVRRPLPLPRKGTGSGIFAVTSVPSAAAGPAGTVTVTAPAGVVRTVAALPYGKPSRAPAAVPRPGTGRGIAQRVIAGTSVTGAPGQLAAAAPAGTVTAVTGTPARPVRGGPAPAPGSSAGYRVRAPAGTGIQADVKGPAGVITVTPVTGTIQAVTGTRGHAVRPRTAMPPARGPGHGRPGTAGSAAAAPAGKITIAAPGGSVQAVTATAGRTAHARTIVPPRRGAGRGQHGSTGSQVTGQPGQAVLAGLAGGISSAVAGPAGTVIVTGPPGFAVLTPYRYTRWRIRRGFSPAGPRSRLIAGNPGKITVAAPAGTVAVQYLTTAAADSAGRINRPHGFPGRRGKAI